MIGVNHDERARQQFALALNRYVQGTLAEGSRRLCEDKVAPECGISSVLDAHDRQLDQLVERCRPKAGDCGTLSLNPELELPRYQAAVDNHSLPGGYHTETRSDDVRQGAIYAHSATMYLLGQTGARHDYRGQTLIAHLLARFPGYDPRDILDLGCLVGASTFAYAEQFPRARLCAVDTSAPALRFAHGLAEARGLPVHFS